MEEQKMHHEGHETHHAEHQAHGQNIGLKLGPEMSLPKFDTKNMDFQGGFKSVLEIFKLNTTAIEQVAKNEKLNMVALIFLVIGVIVGPLANLILGIKVFNMVFHPSLQDTLITMIAQFVMAALAIFVTTLVATKVFNGKGTFAELFRIVGLASIINVLNILTPILPSLGMLISLVIGVYMLVVEFVSLKTVFKMDPTNTVLTMIVTIIVFVILGAIFAAVGLGAAMNPAASYSSSVSNFRISY